jgi:predicted nucleotidyltransferase
MMDREFGLYPASLATVRGILKSYPGVEQAILYGSRAKGNYKTGSDIDLTLVGADLDYNTLGSISGDLDESDIPYKVDLSILANISNPALVEHIQRVGKVFYEREKNA